MIKQPTQPLRFFTSYLEVERDWGKRDKGNPGTHVITEDVLFIPPFQIKFDWRGAIIDDFQNGTMEVINYETGVVTDISANIPAMGVYNYGEYQNLVVFRFPLTLNNLLDEGLYYLKIADGTIGDTTINEAWYSEVFRLCDLNRNLLRTTTGADYHGWDDYNVIDVLTDLDTVSSELCESTGNSAYYYIGDFYVIKDEPLDFFIIASLPGWVFGCAETDFMPLNFALVDSADNIISNTVISIQGAMSEKLIPTVTRDARLKGWVDPDVYGQTKLELYLFYSNPQQYTGLTAICNENENIGTRKVLRWKNSCNICDMIYEESIGQVANGQLGMDSLHFQMSYENHLILDDPPLIPDFAIVENVTEDDSSNKYLLLGNQQEWYYLQLATNQSLAKAIQNIHLHDTVEVDYNGEAHMICENNTEISIGDNYNFTVKFRFREQSCPVQSCCFDVCCPNLLPVLDVLATISALVSIPPSSANVGSHYLVLVGGVYYVYESDGIAWNQLPALNADGNCLLDLDAIADGDQTPYMYWDDVNGNWYRIVYIDSVHDDTGGVAEINLRNYSKPGLKVIVSWILNVGSVRYYSAEFTLDGSASEQLHVTTGATGAGQFDFILYIWDGDCYYGESNMKSQTIT